MQLELVATSSFGLESVVAQELKVLGYNNLKVENGRVAFVSEARAIARCSLWLRSADRLLIQVGRFPAQTFDELFEGTRSLPWPDLLPDNALFPVQGKSIKSRLFSVADCQAIVKKAIVEKLKVKYRRKWFEENGPRFKIEVGLLDNMATLTLDTSGAGLHKRGYRQLSHAAPLKETLAAAMVHLSRWKPDRAFIDPFCGSGTLAIEAALIGRNIAPGLARDFDAEKWLWLPSSIWQAARKEALDLQNPGQALGIFGFDIDPESVRMARHHARLAGLGAGLQFERKDVKELSSRFNYGYLLGNPPYGERIADKSDLAEIYRNLAQLFKRLDTWSFYLLSADLAFEKRVGRQADKRRKLYNGRILCNLFQFFGPRPPLLSGPFSFSQ